MKKIHTHYDNLKVSRDAPIEVLRAAYKSLAQKYHPDKNQNSDDATRVMTAINAAHNVLSDPATRAAHDRWIAAQEFQVLSEPAPVSEPILSTQPAAVAAKHPQAHATKPFIKSVSFGVIARNKGSIAIAGIVAVVIYAVTNEDTATVLPHYKSPPSLAKSSQSPKSVLQTNPVVSAGTGMLVPSSNGVSKKAKYVRPATDPYGTLWPTSARYIQRFDSQVLPGLSSVTIDNFLNDSDVHVKLVGLALSDTTTASSDVLREFYIPAYSKFALGKVSGGRYYIRYRDLSDGGLAASDPFDVTEIETDTGTQFSNVTMTLYKVQNGNMQTHQIGEEDF